MTLHASLRERANRLVGVAALARSPRLDTLEADRQEAPKRFSLFDDRDLGRATALALSMQDAAAEARSDEDGLDAALRLSEAASDRGADPDLVAHAVRLFNTHSPRGRMLRVARPIEVMTESMVSLEKTAPAEAAPLSIWTEDPLANEHHLHWHLVYLRNGLPREDAPAELKRRFEEAGGDDSRFTDDELGQLRKYQDRHGEMFFYMHHQMLARYEAERATLGLDETTSFAECLDGHAVAEGYDVDPAIETDTDGNPDFVDRAPGQTVPPDEAKRLRDWNATLQSAIDAGHFKAASSEADPIPVTIDNLGTNMEAALRIFRSGADLALYGNLHNRGHNVLSALSPAPGGVMRDPTHNIRDPIFWRWHRLIDDLGFRWQERQPTLDFSDRPPAVIAKGADAWSSPDIGFVPAHLLDGDLEAKRSELAARLATLPRLDEAGDAGVPLLDALVTRTRVADVSLPRGDRRAIRHVAHDPFAWAARVTNPSDRPTAVTLRVFIAWAALADRRRSWIELDKVSTALAAGETRVIIRLDRESEVVKKPVDLGPDHYVPAENTDDARCSCGWPYPLLLPRGTAAGQPARLAVVLTDAALDGFANRKGCGSVSFCGARDVEYPDRREMGYPFHRRWTAPIERLFATEPQLAARTITIRHEDESPTA